MKQRIRRLALVVLLFTTLVAGWYVTTTSAARVTACDGGGQFCFQPLMNQPLETLRKVNVPNIAVPAWLSGGGG